MSDARLRRLERSAAEDPESAARALVERIRAGLISNDMVELAAYCGHGPARTAVWQPVPDWVTPEHVLDGETTIGRQWSRPAFREWIERLLVRWNVSEVRTWAGVAAAWATLPWWEDTSVCGGAGHDPHPREAVYAATAWLDCPCHDHEEKLVEASLRAEDYPLGHSWWGRLAVLAVPENPAFISSVLDSYDNALGFIGNALGFIQAAGHVGEKTVRGAVCKALINWALGEKNT